MTTEPGVAPRPKSPFERLRKILIGSPLDTQKQEDTRVPKLLALPIFSSDAISSVAYATQEILLALGAAGLATAANWHKYTFNTWAITGAICVLLALVVASYRQTIFAYPSGGGSYIVSKENLGVKAGLVAAAALMIDYVLTVAVSIASGVQNLLSTPLLHRFSGYPVLICLFFVVLLLVANLRGLKEAGGFFALPTYLFIVVAYTMIALGGFGTWIGWHLHAQPAIPPPVTPHAALGGVTLFVILRAFANGCSAMTGTEAISNGIPAFQKPESKNAATTLTAMAVILGTLFLGISWLATKLHVVYWEHAGQTSPAVIDQISGAVFGRTGTWTWLYYTMQFATAGILVIAANTSFADFPRLASILARDRFLPRQLAHKGDRLVFSNGIIILGIFAAILLIVFKGSVDRLIPLYALGVFTAFTLSQSGMVRHWFRSKGSGWHWKAAVNGIGAVATAIVFGVILVEKGPEGAWVVVVLVVLFVFFFRTIHRHYEWILKQIALGPDAPKIAPPEHNAVRVLIAGAHKGVVPALGYARLLAQDFRAVYVEIDPALTKELKEDWQKYFPEVPLDILESPFRSLIGPTMEYLDGILAKHKKDIVSVIIPVYFTDEWSDALLHNSAGPMLQMALSRRDDIVTIGVRYHIASKEGSSSE